MAVVPSDTYLKKRKRNIVINHENRKGLTFNRLVQTRSKSDEQMTAGSILSGRATSLNYRIPPETHLNGRSDSGQAYTHMTPSSVKRTFAQPGMKPGALVNHRSTSRTKMVSTATSANFIRPSFLYSFSITLYPSLSLSDLPPQPKVCFRLKRGTKTKQR